jgi:hypothetical protein
MGNQPKIVNGEAMELLGQGCRIMDPDKLRNRLGMWQWRNARNLGTLDCFV